MQWMQCKLLFCSCRGCLRTLETASLAPAQLRLKLGAPVMLWRNLTPPEGMCNSTHLPLTHIGRFILEGQIRGGERHGKKRLIPRIPMNTTEGELPWIVSRKQFPIRLCFAMTENKSQGQSWNTLKLICEVLLSLTVSFTLLSRGSLMSQGCASSFKNKEMGQQQMLCILRFLYAHQQHKQLSQRHRGPENGRKTQQDIACSSIALRSITRSSITRSITWDIHGQKPVL